LGQTAVCELSANEATKGSCSMALLLGVQCRRGPDSPGSRRPKRQLVRPGCRPVNFAAHARTRPIGLWSNIGRAARGSGDALFQRPRANALRLQAPWATGPHAERGRILLATSRHTFPAPPVLAAVVDSRPWLIGMTGSEATRRQDRCRSSRTPR
jgi:hypothetical protein